MTRNVATPVVFLGRFSTFAGANDFYTRPINVLGFDSVEITVWRGKLIVSGGFSFELQESVDGEAWTGLIGGDPGEDQEMTLTADFNSSWLRALVRLYPAGGDFPVISCWAVGLLVKRR